MPVTEAAAGRRPLDYVLSALMLFNAIGTAAMYAVILVLGRHSPELDVLRTQAYAVADIPFTVVPQLVAVWAVPAAKRWAPALVLMVSAAYLHGITVMMAEDISASRIGGMFAMDFYFLAFAVLAIFWALRRMGADHADEAGAAG